MRRVVQKDRSGCGVACVAMITNQPYNKVREAALKRGYRKRQHIRMVKQAGETEPLFTSTTDLVNLAKHFGVTIDCKRRKKFKSWKELPDRAILAVNHDKKKDVWHWVVFNRDSKGKQYIIDPHPRKVKNRETRLSKYKPIAGYLPVIEDE